MTKKSMKFLSLSENIDEMSKMALREVPVVDTEDNYLLSNVFLEFHINHPEAGIGAISLPVYDSNDLRRVADILNVWANTMEKKIGRSVGRIEDLVKDDVVKN